MTQEERQQHYTATLAVVCEEYEEVQKELRKKHDRYQALRIARNGLALLAGRQDLMIDHDKALQLTTPEKREEVRRILLNNKK